MDMTLPVTLIVKAPNQQIEDQTVKCELTWTISKLKGHLSEVYPSKPVSESINENNKYCTEISVHWHHSIDTSVYITFTTTSHNNKN